MTWGTQFVTTGLAPSLVVSGVTWGAARGRDRLPERRRWQLADPSRLAIGIAKKLPGEGVDSPPYTGIGQTMALTLVTPSLSRAYRRIEIPTPRFACDAGDDVEHDLLLLGGPKTNVLSAEALRLVGARSGVHLGTDDLRYPRHDAVPHACEGPLTEDHGVVVRMPNPWSPRPRTLVLFAGSHTFGVTAAARFFVSMGPYRRGFSGPFVAVVRAAVRETHVLPPRLVYHARLPAGPAG
jgi:hypothetical protein